MWEGTFDQLNAREMVAHGFAWIVRSNGPKA